MLKNVSAENVIVFPHEGEADPQANDAVWRYLVKGMADDYGSDFSGIRAHAALELHMRECTERRTEDRADRLMTQERLNAMQTSFDARMIELTKTFDGRLSSINNRMWAILLSVCSASVLCVAWFVFHEITRGK